MSDYELRTTRADGRPGPTVTFWQGGDGEELVKAVRAGRFQLVEKVSRDRVIVDGGHAEPEPTTAPDAPGGPMHVGGVVCICNAKPGDLFVPHAGCPLHGDFG